MLVLVLAQAGSLVCRVMAPGLGPRVSPDGEPPVLLGILTWEEVLWRSQEKLERGRKFEEK